MNKSKINVLFVLARYRINDNKGSVLKCRITYLKKRKEFSTGQYIKPKNWNSKQQKVKSPEPDVGLFINPNN